MRASLPIHERSVKSRVTSLAASSAAITINVGEANETSQDPEPAPRPDKPFVLDFSQLWKLPPPLPLATLGLLAVVATIIVLSLITGVWARTSTAEGYVRGKRCAWSAHSALWEPVSVSGAQVPPS